MKNLSILIGAIFLQFLTSCHGQVKKQLNDNVPKRGISNVVGGGCEGCELMYVEMPAQIASEHSSIGWLAGKQKLIVTGKIFQLDGRTPAPNVIVYYWHTDVNGLYSSDDKTPTKAMQHGKLRGWVKSDANGNYTIRTSRPASYPNENIPQHIHLSIKEPEINNEYFVDFYFDDDPLYLTHKKKYGKIDRGGTEILRVVLDGDIEIAEHNIVLGLNIPNYPNKQKAAANSGLNIGEDQPSFMPFHAFGPDRGTTTCPVCKYGRFHGIVYFVGNKPNWNEIKKWLQFLEEESATRSNYLKAYFVYGNENGYSKTQREKELEAIGQYLKLKNIALTFVPSMTDAESEVNLNKINSTIENTFVIYRYRTIVDKFTELKPTEQNFKLISEVLDKTKGNFFDLPEPKH